MTLLTFLGTGNYQSATYRPCDLSRFTGCACPPSPLTTPFFSVALAQWTQPDRVMVISTPEATSKHGELIKAALSGFQVDFFQLPLQSGNESDLWEYFQVLTDGLSQSEELIADITHGFRSTPFVTLLALNYLRVTQGIKIRGIYYGAFDSVPRGQDVPTFDLSPFVDLFQWTAAADSYFQTGDATQLGGLIHQTQQSLWADRNRDKSDNPKSLIPLGKAITQTSQDLRLLRLQDLAHSAPNLAARLTHAQTEIGAFLPPFSRLLNLVADDLSQHAPAALAKAHPNDETPNQTDLSSQLDLIRWLLVKGHPVAALTLGREWIVTALARHLTPTSPPPLTYSTRRAFENLLNFQTNPKASGITDKISHLQPAWENLPESLKTAFEKAWSQTTTPRNDLNHANHNDKSHKASALTRTVDSLLQQFSLLIPKP